MTKDIHWAMLCILSFQTSKQQKYKIHIMQTSKVKYSNDLFAKKFGWLASISYQVCVKMPIEVIRYV